MKMKKKTALLIANAILLVVLAISNMGGKMTATLWVWVGMSIGVAISVWGALLLTRKKGNDNPLQQSSSLTAQKIAPLSPGNGESRQRYEERCLNASKGTLVECWFGCQAGRNGLKAENILPHHKKCDRNPAKKGAAAVGGVSAQQTVTQTNP